MKHTVLTLAMLTVLAAAHPAEARRTHAAPRANPAAVIAAEQAFDRMAQRRGQWTAFRAMAAPGAEMFVPQQVRAADWLRGREDPAVAVRSRPRAVWMSCDGSYGVSHGHWQRPGSSGEFVTVWQRQRNGGYKWLLDMSIDTERAGAPERAVISQPARCSGRPLAARGAGRGAQRSADGTLAWSSDVDAQGKRSFRLSQWRNEGMREVLRVGDTDG